MKTVNAVEANMNEAEKAEAQWDRIEQILTQAWCHAGTAELWQLGNLVTGAGSEACFHRLYKLIEKRLGMPLENDSNNGLLSLAFAEYFPSALTLGHLLDLTTFEFMASQNDNPISLSDALATTNQDRSAIRLALHRAMYQVTSCSMELLPNNTEEKWKPFIVPVDSPMVIGRQESSEPPPPVRIAGDHYDRLVCAWKFQRQVSRRQIFLEYARPGKLMLVNIGTGRVLVEHQRLSPGQSIEVALNAEIELQHVRIRVFRSNLASVDHNAN
ncbi:MAG: hypothetical protein R3C28_26730 [Pirellulaceae bacterium]